MRKEARGNKAKPPPPFFYRLISVQYDFIPDLTKHNGKKNAPKNPLNQKPSFSHLISVKLDAAVSLLRITKQKTRQKECQSRLRSVVPYLTAHVFLSWLVVFGDCS